MAPDVVTGVKKVELHNQNKEGEQTSSDDVKYKASGGAQGRATPAVVRCNLAPGLQSYLGGDLRRRFVPNKGIPTVRELPLCKQLVEGHFLQRFIEKENPLNQSELREILSHPQLSLSLAVLNSGTVPAAFEEGGFDSLSVVDDHDYSRNMWARDAVLVACGLHRGGHPEKAFDIVRNVWEFYQSPEQWSRIVQFHWGDREERRRRFIELNAGPAIKYSLGRNGELQPCNHDWGHQQLDALGAMLWLTYRLPNQRFIMGLDERVFDLRQLDGESPCSESGPPAFIKTLSGLGAEDTVDFGPWEDIQTRRRATSVGIVVAALLEAKKYHERHGWEYLRVAYGGDRNGNMFRDELESLLDRCIRTLKARIPEDGVAIECDERPYDSAMSLLLYPFDCKLNEKRRMSVLRTVYKNMMEIGFQRWSPEPDLPQSGADLYVGQDYHRNLDPRDKGEFAKLVPGYRAPGWTMFDFKLAADSYRVFIDSGGLDVESLLRADRHFKRGLSYITSKSETLYVAGKERTYTIPAGVLPEAYFWDSQEERWRPNHNTPLLWAQSQFALAFARAIEASKVVVDSIRQGQRLQALYTEGFPF